MIGRIILVLALVALSDRVFSAASGLNIIPTADFYSRGTLALEAERGGIVSNGLDGGDTSYYVQAGIGRGIEAGYDKCSDGHQFCAWNFKVALAYRDSQPALALGAQNLSAGLKWQPYVVGHLSLGRARLHGGAIAIEGDIKPMLGCDAPVSGSLTLMADVITGSENAASFGLAIGLPQNLGLTISYVRNHIGTDRHNYLLLLGWYPQGIF
ncbi:MAG: hypothetical protein HYX78_05455 [Armatimonadetes bacterium]|nr:hypothetical protein [Armatimonadota bacterium]